MTTAPRPAHVLALIAENDAPPISDAQARAWACALPTAEPEGDAS